MGVFRARAVRAENERLYRTTGGVPPVVSLARRETTVGMTRRENPPRENVVPFVRFRCSTHNYFSLQNRIDNSPRKWYYVVATQMNTSIVRCVFFYFFGKNAISIFASSETVEICVAANEVGRFSCAASCCAFFII